MTVGWYKARFVVVSGCFLVEIGCLGLSVGGLM